MRPKTKLTQASPKPLPRPLLVRNLQKLDILPASAQSVIRIYQPSFHFRIKLPFYASHVPAGFPSPADDHLDKFLDLNEVLIQNKQSTFFLEVDGDSMKGCGIFDKAIILVDKSLKARNGDVVLGVLYGEFTCKRLKIEEKRIYLAAENPAYPDTLVTEEMNFRVWGVVTYAINSLVNKVR